ncbi:50S ribosomal protein L9 [Patescibacteria group bacterium]|nr:50S ribosomal protein L9 [Patescibacteria group bacterium]MBU1890113.1 50S ribosomal protein L9 [Patescibacteria group bacterium]
MKVILLKDIDNLGHAGDLKNVSDGHARNFLIPKKLVVPATLGNLKQSEKLLKKRQAAQEQAQAKLKTLLSDIEGLKIDIKAKTTAEGKLYAGLDAIAIAKEIKKQKGIEIPESNIKMGKAIKKIGEHEIKVEIDKKSVIIKLTVRSSDEK